MEHKNPWFSVFSRGGYYSLEYDRPQVVVIPIVDGRNLLMIRVYRPLIDDSPLEFPAGDSIHGETPREAASREFCEETGISIKDGSRFVTELPMSEMSNRMPVLLSVFSIHLTLEEYDSRSKHDSEVCSIELISFTNAISKMLSGEIYGSSTCALLARKILSTKTLKQIIRNSMYE